MVQRSSTRPGPTIAFMPDMSVASGGGHITRSLALAAELRALGADTIFFGSEGNADSVKKLVDQGQISSKVGISSLEADCFDAVVIDDYSFDRSKEKALRNRVETIVVIDERLTSFHDADILIDQTPGRTRNDVSSMVPQACEILVGGEFALLRPQFLEAKKRRMGFHDAITDQKASVYISVGLTDPRGAVEFVLKELAALKSDISIDVAVGSSTNNLREIQEACSRFPRATLHIDHSEVWRLMESADIAIGAAGVTSLERCCVGLPSVAFVLAPNQDANAQALADAGAAMVLGAIADIRPGAIANAVVYLISNPGKRRLMSEACVKLVDGVGAKRAASRILDRLGGPN